MFKIVLIFAALALPVVLVSVSDTRPAHAQRYKNSGYCPEGTCSMSGTKWAVDLRNCKKRYCTPGTPPR
jgi:hypothetical protein